MCQLTYQINMKASINVDTVLITEERLYTGTQHLATQTCSDITFITKIDYIVDFSRV